MQVILQFLTQRFSLLMFATLIVGIIFQDLAKLANPTIKVLLMTAIYLSLLKIDFFVLKNEFKRPLLQLYLVIFTNFILPITLFLIMKLTGLLITLDSQWAVGVLVLFGSSTASLSPALCILMKGHVERAIINMLLSSLLVPFSLPLILKVMSGSSFKFDVQAMILDLVYMIAIPVIATLVTTIFFKNIRNKSLPYIAPISVLILCVIVLGCVDGLRSKILEDPLNLLIGITISYIMFFFAFALGWIGTFKGTIQDKTTLAILCAWPNVGLIIVISNLYFKIDYPLILIFAILSEIPWNTTFGPAQKFIQFSIKKAETLNKEQNV